ncbi:MAG: hypothetical protein M3Z05_02005 [Gemmatimonadota bacterium]|nr:hypothetical protein [Gemmatimonadota bacterium]
MPESYVIDPSRKIVTCRAWGDFTNADLYEHYRRLAADPRFEPEFAQLADLTGVTEFSVKSAVIESAARNNIFAPGSARAIVASRGVAFGLARMFAAYTPEDQMVRVFATLREAEAWLERTRVGTAAGSSEAEGGPASAL